MIDTPTVQKQRFYSHTDVVTVWFEEVNWILRRMGPWPIIQPYPVIEYYLNFTLRSSQFEFTFSMPKIKGADYQWVWATELVKKLSPMVRYEITPTLAPIPSPQAGRLGDRQAATESKETVAPDSGADDGST